MTLFVHVLGWADDAANTGQAQRSAQYQRLPLEKLLAYGWNADADRLALVATRQARAHPRDTAPLAETVRTQLAARDNPYGRLVSPRSVEVVEVPGVATSLVRAK